MAIRVLLFLLFLGLFDFARAQEGVVTNGESFQPSTDQEIVDLLIEEKINRTLRVRDGMLLAHEILGWSTVALLSINTFITTPGVVEQDTHTAMGISAGSLYFSTALLGWATPKLHEGLVFGGEKESPSKFLHKLLVFVHFPAMITTIVLGILLERSNEGELDISPANRIRMREAHTATSLITVTSLTLSMIVVYLN